MNDCFTIIIADDDIDDQEFLKTAIQEVNPKANVLCVSDGSELMNVLETKTAHDFSYPDLIFLDLNMPLMDGYEVLRSMKINVHLKSIPVFVLTTSEFEYDKIKSIAYGADGFYSKPMTPTALKNIVAEVFSKCQKLAQFEVMKKRVS
ncbi:MAG TPA: response regulator [Bacteroidia bacterium]|jgi:CheY-like chemotaxis protein|nr:response regulator [Bacteroidia bacterium]HRG52611.1 response regulator [Bacteroidia bacterium]